MALENLLSVKFTEEEKKEVFTCLERIEEILNGKVINLTPEEKQEYGRIGEKTEEWIRKVNMWMDQKPEAVPYYLDLEEFRNDIKVRDMMKPLMGRLKLLAETLDDTSVILSTDIYNIALAYYRNIKIVSRANVPGTSEIYNDLSKQFPGRPSTVPEDENLSIRG